jgi:NitT/TauT family transport system substrate-binding protein
MKSGRIKIVVIVVLIVGVLALLRFKPWQSDKKDTTKKDSIHDGPNDKAMRSLTVGYLPVTCHLTCPVTDFASKTTSSNTNFNSQRFSDFPTVVSALEAKTIQATFMNVPLAMKMREDGVPVKICYLGHRDGSEIIIGINNKANNLRDLKGQTIAFPSPYSNQRLVFTKLMEDQGMKEGDINMVILPPPDMPTSLASGAIDGYFVAEPMCAKSEMEGIGRVLYMSRDIWPDFISCALVVHEDLIKENPEVVRDLIRGIAESGKWVEKHREEAATLVQPYYRQDKKILDYVLTTTPHRVRYENLTPTDEELQKIHDMAVKMGVLKKPMDMKEMVDNSFIPKEIGDAPIDIKKNVKK